MSTPKKHVYEIISFAVSDGYMKDRSLFKPVTDFIGENSPGPIYTGLQLNDPNHRLTGFVGWDFVKQHEDFEKEPGYANLGPLVQPVAGGESQVYHAAFEGDEVSCFKAPVTELVWITPRPGVKVDDVAKMVAQATEGANDEVKKGKRLHLDGEEHECFGVAWRWVVEKDMLVYIAGWSSLQAREQFVKDNAEPANKSALGITVNVRLGHHWHVKQASSHGEVATTMGSFLELQDGRATSAESGAGSANAAKQPGHINGEPVYEVIQFPTSEKYAQDHQDYNVFKPMTDFISEHAPGNIYVGLQVEDPTNRLTGFIGWHSVQQHEDFEKQPVYAELSTLVEPIAAGESVVYHVSFEGADELTLFDAPLTELDIITPQGGATADDIEPLVKFAADLCNDEIKKGKRMNKNGNERENYGAAWGRVVGQEIFLYVGGWKDVKTHAAWAETWEKPMNEKTKDLKILRCHRHHWIGEYAMKYSDVATQKIVHLQLTDGRD